MLTAQQSEADFKPRSDVCKIFYDAYETNEERYQHTPPLWPEDQWRWVVDYWSSEEYQKIRETGKINRSKLDISHTSGSVNYQNLRVQIMKKTNVYVDELDFFVVTRTSKKKKGFVDERSKKAVEKMEELVREHTDESGVCSLTRQEAVEQVMGPGTKGRERGQGRMAKPPRSKITPADLERAREEMREEIAEMREEMRQDFQSLMVQAVAEALRLYYIQQIPPTQGTGSQQPPSAEEDNELNRASR